ncbi:MAG: hypothetical protein GY796_30935 [Chloroflexi bacterium]|nr:hypothetical protein [Chloroflexota bacterium]
MGQQFLMCTVFRNTAVSTHPTTWAHEHVGLANPGSYVELQHIWEIPDFIKQ